MNVLVPMLVVLVLIVVGLVVVERGLLDRGGDNRGGPTRRRTRRGPAEIVFESASPTLETLDEAQEDSREFPFVMKERFLTRTERSFYGVLKMVADSRGWDVFGKVRLEDIIEVLSGSDDFQAQRNRIKSRHVDFLVCDRATVRPLLAIELNDSSHANERRQERDAFISGALRAAGMPLATVSARRAYSLVELGAIIDEKLGVAAPPVEIEAPAPNGVHVAASSGEASVTCPKCGSPLVERQSRNTGRRFLGCSTYPACHYMQGIETSAPQ